MSSPMNVWIRVGAVCVMSVWVRVGVVEVW